jgi:asparagine synthase (glutamine-hydrolysing)
MAIALEANDAQLTGWHFIALPDHQDAAPIADAFLGEASSVIQHPSGRPLLLAHLPADQIVVGGAGNVRVAIIGQSSATPARVERCARGVGDVTDLDDLSHELAGSFHLLASVDGKIRVQGTASGVRRAFYGTVNGLTVMSDRADVLARLGGFRLDDVALAVRLLRMQPHPLPELPLWTGVEHVPPDHYAVIDRDGRYCTRRWWRRPEPELSRLEGALRLRAALSDAVDARTRAGGTVHSDLSGGLDSTPVTYFASRGRARVRSVTMYSDEPGGHEDLRWARKALASLPSIDHQTRSLVGMPDFFEGLLETEEPMDDPGGSYLPVPRVRASIAEAQGAGARLYLNGLGGDHLLRGLPVWDHTLLRSHPVLALRRARAVQLWEERSLPATLRGLMDRRSYQRWFTAMAAKAIAGTYQASRPTLEWDEQVVIPPWLSKDMTSTLLDRLRVVAHGVEPLGDDRAGHAELSMVRSGSRTVRGAQQVAAIHGMPFESPFLDDRVVESCFAVRREERDTPQELKPLIKEAMRGLLPDDFLRRQTKSGGNAQGVRGHSSHWPDLLDLCRASSLVTDGIMGEQAFIEHASPRNSQTRDRSIDATLNCAIFLRAQARSAAGRSRVADGGKA